MAKRKMNIAELEKELKKRQAIERIRTQNIQKIGKKQALIKKVRELRYKQSQLGRTVTAGKIIFSRIGKITGDVGKGFSKAGQKSAKTGEKEHKKAKKRISVDEMLRRLPQ